ncbi:GNAT family N-acetyltransferase [Cryomorphaceae bacterium 1068]|nr:GNAT family N-acetyltransferase [Cryomorphaceae bacterium 1068]
MTLQTHTELNSAQKKKLMQLWNTEYPAGLNYLTLDHFDGYLDKLEDVAHFLLTDKEGLIKGWYFDFRRDGEKWFGLIINSSLHGQGFGKALLDRAKSIEKELSGWVIDSEAKLRKEGQPYRSPLEFYQKNGFEVLENVRLELPRISAVKVRWRL